MHIREYNSLYGDTPSENDAIEATTEAFTKAQMLVLVKVLPMT